MIQICDFTIELGGRVLFSPINLQIQPKTITVLMGTSGVGKSSILGAISGSVKYSGSCSAPQSFTIYQDSHQLFPWYTVRKNLDLVCNSNYMQTVNDWKLTELLDSTPSAISGGQRQRFTLIRAMYSGRPLLLCDEPLSGLDALTRYFVLEDFKKKIVELGLSVFYVTHDINEAKYIGDSIYLLKPNGLTTIDRNINEVDFIQQLDH